MAACTDLVDVSTVENLSWAPETMEGRVVVNGNGLAGFGRDASPTVVSGSDSSLDGLQEEKMKLGEKLARCHRTALPCVAATDSNALLCTCRKHIIAAQII